MTESEREEFEFVMQGRIIALELFMRNLLMAQIGAMEGDPLENAERFKKLFLASLQNLDRPFDDYGDKVWAAASDAVRLQLDRVIYRMKRQRS